MGELEIYGSKGRTYKDPETGEVIADAANPYKGRIQEIRGDRHKYKTSAEREAAAAKYESDINELLDSGLELVQAKTIMDLREGDKSAVNKMTFEFMERGMSPSEAFGKAQEIYAKKDAKRVALIRDDENGIVMTVDNYKRKRLGLDPIPPQPKAPTPEQLADLDRRTAEEEARVKAEQSKAYFESLLEPISPADIEDLFETHMQSLENDVNALRDEHGVLRNMTPEEVAAFTDRIEFMKAMSRVAGRKENMSQKDIEEREAGIKTAINEIFKKQREVTQELPKTVVTPPEKITRRQRVKDAFKKGYIRGLIAVDERRNGKGSKEQRGKSSRALAKLVGAGIALAGAYYGVKYGIRLAKHGYDQGWVDWFPGIEDQEAGKTLVHDGVDRVSDADRFLDPNLIAETLPNAAIDVADAAQPGGVIEGLRVGSIPLESTVWGTLDSYGVHDPTNTLLNAVEAYNRNNPTHPAIWHGSGTGRWISIGDDSSVAGILNELQPHIFVQRPTFTG